MLAGAGGMIGVQNFVGRDVCNAYAAAFHEIPAQALQAVELLRGWSSQFEISD